ncbi:MAG: hypothetical protein IJS01_08465 [Lentisphaeria bacterium]|nr:hypothetical protein [Lentisphaeria bacterium]
MTEVEKTVHPLRLGAVLACLLSLSVAAAPREKSAEEILLRQWPGNARIAVPEVERAPVIDGVIDPGEWKNAAEFSGFTHLNGNYVTAGKGSVYLMRDKNYLYFAVRTTTPNNDPGGSLTANATVHDGKVHQDDALDFMLISDRDPRKMYHWIVNARDTVFDRVCPADRAAGEGDVSWNFRHLKCRSRVDKGFWDLEMACPLEEAGSPEKFLKLNVGRSWNKAGPSLLNPSGKYFDVKRMITVSLGRNSGVLREFDPGDVGRGEWRLALEADNPSPRELCLALLLRHFTYAGGKKSEHRDVVKAVRIPPGKSGGLDAAFQAQGNQRYHYSAVLFEPVGGKVHASRSFAGARGLAERHPVSVSFSVKGQGAGTCRYYPGYDKATAEFRPSGKKVSHISLVLPGGREVPGKAGRDLWRFSFPVPSAPGRYAFALRIDSALHENAFQLEKKSFPWLHGDLGKDKIVLPPFKPLVSDGAVLGLAHSRIALSGTGLWENFEAEGVPMLASPMRWEAVVGGKTFHAAAGKLSEPETEDAGYALRHSFRTKLGESVVLAGVSRVEYDGFQYVDVTLSGAPQDKLERLTLQIPLRDAETPFFHAVSNFIRENPSGRIPAGEGIVWDGSKLPRRTAAGQETLHPQAVPYLWLGGTSRGAAVFFETTCGYALSRTKSAVRLIRKNGVLTVEWDIVNRPVTLKTPRHFSFGLMPTPVKRADPALRHYTHDSLGIGAREMKNFTFIGRQLMGFALWEHEAFARDYTLFRAACRAVRNGGKDDMAKELDDWLARYEPRMRAQMKQVPNAGDYPEHYRKVRINFRRSQLQNPARRPSLPYKYTDPKLAWMFEEIPEYFRAEWYNPAPQSYFGARRTSLTPSAVDYLVHCLDLELRNGAHGIYLDDMYLMPDPNPETLAKTDPEGVVHPAMGILGMRELVKRVAVLQHKRGLYPRLLQIHMTNALLIPCFSLATSTLGWEKNYGETPLPTRFAVDDILTTGTGLQVGAESCVLGGIKRQKTPAKAWPQVCRKLTRSLIALSLPFGAKFKAPVTRAGDAEFYFSVISLAGEFGFWKPECRFVPFWEAGAAALRVDSPDVLASSWRLPGKVLLVLGNMSGKDQTLKLAVDREKLGLRSGFEVKNAETGKAEMPAGIALAPYDFKLLILE